MAKIYFRDRTALEEFVRTEFGTDAQANADKTIEMTTEEMKRLSVSDSTRIYGVKIIREDD